MITGITGAFKVLSKAPIVNIGVISSEVYYTQQCFKCKGVY